MGVTVSLWKSFLEILAARKTGSNTRSTLYFSEKYNPFISIKWGAAHLGNIVGA